ncbi:ammecr1 family protein [Metarhizium album ARSEF 1941]|uniref:Ammecr1 family protein n=1 Tax=Metarhizium album (strain ARSEF 1941) TaxID=1081103 RepID=A0A0B2WSX7_METAS|nr:ammecr1 family protein [Metarhizium album ARSEF 1941]KHN97138.1 ammecr1 family protein [Metarhizium album ARSEF 1941]
MASAAHCLMCFEALDAHLEDRKPLSLGEIESSWALYTSSVSDSEPGVSSGSSGSSSSSNAPALKAPALRRLAADSDSAESSSSASPAWSSSTPATSTSSLSLGAPSAPLFVTWNTVSGHDVSLRGCIGTFESQPLSVALPEYATISALQDTRFSPIAREELPELQAAVTLLTDFEEADDAYDWEVGLHGIRLSFVDRGHRYGATYLPDVASEQGWTQDEALYSLVRKAGWMGGRSRWKSLALKVTRYQGKKASLDYPEYKKWKDWVASRQ